MKRIFILLNFFLLVSLIVYSQEDFRLWEEEKTKSSGDWLLYKVDKTAELYRTGEGNLVFANGLISRTFTVKPNGATIGLAHLQTGESFLRSVRPEAEVQIDGISFEVGGLKGQPIHNYLYSKWLENMESDQAAFKLVDYRLENTKERFPWKKRKEWITCDIAWPAAGKELIFRYKLDDKALDMLARRTNSDEKREILFNDTFLRLNKEWRRVESDADPRNSFVNEGKVGEIMALSNTSVYAERSFISGTKVLLVKIDPGTDKSIMWGPGLGLVFNDKVVKINLLPGNNEFAFFDGEKMRRISGMNPGEAVWLRMEIKENTIEAFYSYNKVEWRKVGEAKVNETVPRLVRVGKMDREGGKRDHPHKREIGLCRIEAFQMLGDFSPSVKNANKEKNGYFKDIFIEVHYELYDGLPVFCKWITIKNNSDRAVTVNSFKSEILAVPEAESVVDEIKNWLLPNITLETDYNFGGMSRESIYYSSVVWKEDSLYETQANYARKTPCLLEVYPKYGPDQVIEPNCSFASFRVWELLHDSWDRERKGLEHRRVIRSLAPWITENPILMHVRSADDQAVKKAIDQCAEVGFEMVIMTFGSGFNAEDTSNENLDRMKKLTDYAHSKGIALGGYSLLASRRVGGGNDVVMPPGMTPRFGNSPCLESKWGHEYFEKLYTLYEKTGLDVLEHDGSYPGDVCASTEHPGHKGLSDSQWKQYHQISSFYKWCRSRGIYLNVPDYYFLVGSNKTGMGYRETNWSLPRAMQEIIERQNVYDGTWEKTPSMGWMFVPLVEYHGGGEEATIEPLKEHLSHYEQRLANLFGAGVQACYRGPQLYDAPETKALVEKWVMFYKEHRQVLDGDIIHLRRPDGRDWDGFLHVNPSGKEKGLLMLYNPLQEDIVRELEIPVYYTGLHDRIFLEDQKGCVETIPVSRDYKIRLKIVIPAHGYSYYVMR